MSFTRQRLKQFFDENKLWLTTWSVAAITVLAVIHFWPQPPSPVPQSIRSRSGFPIIYPANYSVDSKSWKYLQSEASVQFTVKESRTTVVFTEQKTPLAYQNDAGAYGRFIGSLRPRANFAVPLGTVSISNFVTAGSYQVVGETGILNAQGTMLFVHPDTQVSDDVWRQLFQSLKVD